MENGKQPGHGLAVGSLVLGIIAIVLWFFGYSAIVSLILGIIGLVLASRAKAAGNQEGVRTAGFVLCLIATIVGAIIFISCVACAGVMWSAFGGL